MAAALPSSKGRSKWQRSAENHAYSVATHFMDYNFVRIHQSLRIARAMAAGVTTKHWSLTDMARVIKDWERRAPRSWPIGWSNNVGADHHQYRNRGADHLAWL